MFVVKYFITLFTLFSDNVAYLNVLRSNCFLLLVTNHNIEQIFTTAVLNKICEF